MSGSIVSFLTGRAARGAGPWPDAVAAATPAAWAESNCPSESPSGPSAPIRRKSRRDHPLQNRCRRGEREMSSIRIGING